MWMFDFNPDAFHEQYDTAIMITSTINLKKKSHGFEMGPWPLASNIGGAKKADECQSELMEKEKSNDAFRAILESTALMVGCSNIKYFSYIQLFIHSITSRGIGSQFIYC